MHHMADLAHPDYKHQDNERVNMADLVAELCQRLGLNPNYVTHIEMGVDQILTVDLYRGTEGICKGTKFINRGLPGLVEDAATEQLQFRVQF